MSRPLFLPMPGNETLTRKLAAKLGWETGSIETRHFPDGETYLKIDAGVQGRATVVVCTLDRPDPKFLPLSFAADGLRDLGCTSVGLAAPYLAYMRQDRHFHTGDVVTSRSFARALSDSFDWLVTVDPHLHRYKSLEEIYTMPTQLVHAAPAVAEWIKQNVKFPMLVGPDAESAQWVSDVAQKIGAPFIVLEKIREGDRNVEIRLPVDARCDNHTPVLLDDIVASGDTMLKAVRAMRQRMPKQPVCVAVHGIFAENAHAALIGEGAHVVTCNTVGHETNAIDISGLLADGIAAAIDGHQT